MLNYIKSLIVGVGGYTGTQVHTLLHLFFKLYKKFNSWSRGVHGYTGTHPTSSIFKLYKKFNSWGRGVHGYTGTHPTSYIFKLY